MAHVSFTANLARHRPVRSVDVPGQTLAEALGHALAGDDFLQSYILDEQGRLRKHVNIFVDGEMVADRARLSDPIRKGADIYIMQALSGG